MKVLGMATVAVAVMLSQLTGARDAWLLEEIERDSRRDLQMD